MYVYFLSDIAHLYTKYSYFFISNYINFYFLNNYLSDLLFQSRKTSHLRGFVFSNYQNLNNGNLLLESGEILKQKWHKTTKNGMLKLTYIKAL